MSKGMQQRLGLAQALVGTPRLLLLEQADQRPRTRQGDSVVRDLLAELRPTE